jgi:hypothetical protein
MKNYILSACVTLLLSSTTSFACEICGCSSGNFQIGLLPNFNKGFAGLRYSYSHFNSRIKSDPTQFSNDYYRTVELWGGYSYKRMQVMTFMPYVFSRKESDDGVAVSNGIGDLMLLINYKVWTSARLTAGEKTTVMHELYVGGGVKLPTGINRVNTSNVDFNVGDFNSQAGTGSVDYVVNATHNLMWNNSGIVTNVAYRMNTANSQGYRFGDRAYINSAFYHTFTKSGLKMKPNIGVNYQSNNMNKYSGDAVAGSKGYNLNATAGINVLYKDIGINAMAFIPVSQNYFDGQTKLASRFLIGVTYSF